MKAWTSVQHRASEPPVEGQDALRDARRLRSEGKSTLFRPDQFHIKTGLVKYGLLAGAVRLTDEFEIGR